MPCDTVRAKDQTLEQRKTQVREAIAILDRLLLRRQVRVVVSPTGAVAFVGEQWDSLKASNKVTDACAYRRIMQSGSSLAKAEIARAELMAGRTVNRQTVAQGVHSHDGGQSWHGKG